MANPNEALAPPLKVGAADETFAAPTAGAIDAAAETHATKETDDSTDARLLAVEQRLTALEVSAVARFAKLERFVQRLFHPREWSH